jgi:hypothetical protein
MQSLRLEGGVVREQYAAFELDGDRGLARDASGVPVRKDRAGDGTVYRDAAHLGANSDRSVTYLPLQHGALAKNSVALRYVRAVITEYDTRLGPPMGGGEIGLVLPDCAPVGSVWTLRLSGADTYVGIRCTVHEAETGRLVDTPRLAWQDGGIAARVTLPAAGLYRVRVETGGNPPVTQLVMALGSDGD